MRSDCRLRALLIQKEIKLCSKVFYVHLGLRALLIQKEIKPRMQKQQKQHRLRALLIQKEIKLKKWNIAFLSSFSKFDYCSKCLTQMCFFQTYNRME